MGYGPIEPFLADATVTEVMVNGTDYIYVERGGVIEQTNARFICEEHLRRVIDRIVVQVGRRIDESSPMVDARLPDGSRVNAIVPPLSPGRLDPHHPEVRQGPVPGGGPGGDGHHHARRWRRCCRRASRAG